MIVALGASAAESVLGKPVRIGDVRGRALSLRDGTHVWVTVHPSYLLRLPDPAAQVREHAAFVADLAGARAWVAARAGRRSAAHADAAPISA